MKLTAIATRVNGHFFIPPGQKIEIKHGGLVANLTEKINPTSDPHNFLILKVKAQNSEQDHTFTFARMFHRSENNLNELAKVISGELLNLLQYCQRRLSDQIAETSSIAYDECKSLGSSGRWMTKHKI